MQTLPRAAVVKFASTKTLQDMVIIEQNNDGTVCVVDGWRRIIEKSKTPERKIKAWRAGKSARKFKEEW
jgi:hypothetical protein